MYEKVSAKMIMILVTAAIVTVPSSMLQVLYAQSDLQSTCPEYPQPGARYRWSSAAHVERQSRSPSPDLC